ncbi:hypothetical protein HYU09_04320 [Candidatus Woesearchaeota archaeon]|nr:hypothetical protein [Candidatus Woesearchaeota archaeon]
MGRILDMLAMGKKTILSNLPSDLNKRIQQEISSEKQAVRDLEEMWREASEQKKEVIRAAQEIDIEFSKFKVVWDDTQSLERDAAIILAHKKKYDEMVALVKGKLKSPIAAIGVNRQRRELDQTLERFEMLLGRDEDQMLKDLEKAEQDIKDLAQLQNNITKRGISRSKLGRAILKIIEDMNKRMNVARRACGKAERDIAALLKRKS